MYHWSNLRGAAGAEAKVDGLRQESADYREDNCHDGESLGDGKREESYLRVGIPIR